MRELAELFRERQASLYGYGDLTALPPGPRSDLPRGVSIALALDPTVVAGIAAGPTREYFAEYERKNALLTILAEEAAELLRSAGNRAVAVPVTGVGIDWKRLATPWLPHKTVATRAGLGWIGKCALLVTPRFGPMVRLATVLTDAELPVGRPVNWSLCGDCFDCVAACPAGAPSGRNWHVGMERSAFYDAAACCENCRAMSAAAGIDGTICGICIAACPYTKKYLELALD